MSLKNEIKIPMREKLLRSRNDCDTEKYKCLKCDTTFSSIKTLYRHMFSIHAAERVYYSCPLCDVTFVQLWTVCRHLIKVHKKSKEEADFLKESIKTKFSTKKRKQQMKKYFGPELECQMAGCKVMTCRHCSRDFSTKANLRRHLARHLGLARYWCELCNYKAFDRSQCYEHVKKKHLTAEPSHFIINKESGE